MVRAYGFDIDDWGIASPVAEQHPEVVAGDEIKELIESGYLDLGGGD